MKPMGEIAAGLAPRDTGQLAGSIAVSAKAVGAGADIGKAEYSAIMRAGGSKAEAGAAMRAKRRDVKASGSSAHVELFMGPQRAKDKRTAIKQIVQEFGTRKMQANPYMRPAWDRDKNALLQRVQHELWREIRKTVARAEKAGKLIG